MGVAGPLAGLVAGPPRQHPGEVAAPADGGVEEQVLVERPVAVGGLGQANQCGHGLDVGGRELALDLDAEHAPQAMG